MTTATENATGPTAGRPQFCLDCGRERRGTEYGCPDCGCDIYGPTVSGRIRPRIRKDARKKAQLRGVLGAVLRLPPGACGVLVGGEGLGKSTLALSAFKRPHVVTNEMAPQLVKTYAKRIGGQLERISQPYIDGDALELGVRDDVGELVVDSVSAMEDPLGVTIAVRDWCRAHGARALVILHVTKDNRAAGARRILHEVDATAYIENADGLRRVRVPKSRHGPARSVLFQLDDNGARLPAWDRYYSVEGSRPHFQIVGFPPTGRAPYAGALRAANAGALELPPAPVAVSAQDGGRLYKGWIEPQDGAERRAFALSHGLPYYDVAAGKLYEVTDDLTIALEG